MKKQSKRIKLTLEYDGTDFSGFQVQPGKRTVQAELEKTLIKFLDAKTKVFASGRTDAGVHALCQVVHFDSEKQTPLTMLVHELNKSLPPDIAVVDAEYTSPDFDARRMAKEKSYVIKFYLSRFDRPVFANRQIRINDNTDIKSMQKGCKFFVGEHDFTSFVARKSGKTDFVRRVYSAEIVKVGKKEYEFRITGNGFLYNMVRIIFGTLLLVGAGKIKPEDTEKIILAKNRKQAGKTVSAHGLYLTSVKY